MHPPPSSVCVSVVTVNLNNRDGLVRTRDSLIRQKSNRAFEWIVVDGGSSDGSASLLEAPGSFLPAWWVSERDQGIYFAMNKGVQPARGEYLLFLNSGDELVDESALDRMLGDIPPGTDIAYGSLIIVENNHEEWTWTPPDPQDLSLVYWLRDDGTLPHPSTLIRRALLLDCPYDTTFRVIADRVFFFSCFLAGKKLHRWPFVVSKFRLDGLSSESSALELRREEREAMFLSYMKPVVLHRLRADALRAGDVDIERWGTHAGKILSGARPPEPLRRWIDLFFFMERTPVFCWVLRLLLGIMRACERYRKDP